VALGFRSRDELQADKFKFRCFRQAESGCKAEEKLRQIVLAELVEPPAKKRPPAPNQSYFASSFICLLINEPKQSANANEAPSGLALSLK